MQRLLQRSPRCPIVRSELLDYNLGTCPDLPRQALLKVGHPLGLPLTLWDDWGSLVRCGKKNGSPKGWSPLWGFPHPRRGHLLGQDGKFRHRLPIVTANIHQENLVIVYQFVEHSAVHVPLDSVRVTLELVLLEKVTSVRKVDLTIDSRLEIVASIDLLKQLNASIPGMEEIRERAHKGAMLLEDGQNRVNEGKNILFSTISEIPNISSEIETLNWKSVWLLAFPGVPCQQGFFVASLHIFNKRVIHH
ncbi:hypothetical protein TEA_023308 [Camellia sinensis var. sinensis]|uniref:Uncharacterized protein n=1 Tax=Camellia sinensis var. sinensis TaxID=542762 RepID=A0A4S4DFR8_CAMSN|nr:hypothetical protein TEA_023308 [Camellia sinensis var. sinensis]